MPAPTRLERIPDGYRLAVLDPSGTIVDTIDVGDTNTRATFAALDVGNAVAAAVELHETRR